MVVSELIAQLKLIQMEYGPNTPVTFVLTNQDESDTIIDKKKSRS